MSVVLEKEDGVRSRIKGLEDAPNTIVELVEAALRAGVSEDEIRVVPMTRRDPMLVIRGRTVAAWLRIA